EYAHERGVKVYLTLNTMPREYEYGALREYLDEISDIPLDAMIIGDIGVLMLVKRVLPDMELHISTQANSVSAEDCLAWHQLGAKRVVLARELTLEEIKAIRQRVPEELELECFIHGSMCISYSGRCLLSGHILGRDANRGGCAQPCRWNYRVKRIEVVEDKRPDAIIPIEEIDGESFIMSSKDTCTIEHIPELVEAGINSFKIEGRMKSAYYTAVVTNTYKMALDSYFSGNYSYDERWYRELLSVSHRDYATGYYFKDSHLDANTAECEGYIKDKAFLAVAVGYDEATGEGIFTQRNKLKLYDELELLTPGMCGRDLVCEGLCDELGNPIEATPHPYMTFRMKTPFEVKVGDILRAK
ncbi:MAG: U32 family peptidase C-terminal domain-containing protein, partial [Clostridia bacterium]|nr:U32 family peptidase C-terminal domain-containing protein [Clostridia bacterium]